MALCGYLLFSDRPWQAKKSASSTCCHTSQFQMLISRFTNDNRGHHLTSISIINPFRMDDIPWLKQKKKKHQRYPKKTTWPILKCNGSSPFSPIKIAQIASPHVRTDLGFAENMGTRKKKCLNPNFLTHPNIKTLGCVYPMKSQFISYWTPCVQCLNHH